MENNPTSAAEEIKSTPVNYKLRKQQQVHTLYMQAPISNGMIYIIALLFSFILASRVESPLITVWSTALIASATFRLFLWYLWRRRPTRYTDEHWLRWYLFASVLIGLSWSLIFPLIYLFNDLIVNMVLSMLIFGIVGASVIALSVYLPAFFAYTFPQILTLVITLLFLDQQAYYLLSFGIFLYLLMITLFARNLNRQALQSIDLIAQNMVLIDELNQEVNQRESLVQERTEQLNEKNIQLQQEISERRKIEQDLLNNQQQLSSIFESSPAGMALLDTDYRYTLINETLARINGKTVAEHIGKSVKEIVPESEHIIIPMLDQIMATKKPVINADISIEVPSRPDEVSYFTVSYFPITGKTLKVCGIGAIVTDITERRKVEVALKESQERFRLAMLGANDGLYDWNLIDNSIYYSPRWKSMLGYQEDELPDDFSVWEDLVEPDDRERSWNMLSDYIDGKRDNFHLEFKMKHKDGHWVDILSRAFLVRNEENKPVRVVGTHLDISEIKYKDEQILVLSHALEQSPVSVVITDTNADIEYVNRAFENISGYLASEVIGKNPRIFKSGLTPVTRYKEMWNALLAKQTWAGEIQNRKKNGDIFWESAQIAPVVDSTGTVTHYIGIKEDITSKKQQEEKILYQAHFDSLTGLPNRFLALDRLEQSIKEALRSQSFIAVLFIDLDGFKRINDSLGHDIGDRLLIKTAERLSSEVREEDTLCRLGGDEFVLILHDVKQADDAQVVASNLLSCINEAFILDDRELTISASIGIAIYPENADSSSELLRNADMAMYYAKEQGRNNYQFYTESMRQDVSRRMSIEQELFTALANNQFMVKYQPLYELKSNQLRGVEALLRWHSPVLGDVPPEEFIPIAEQCGVIDEIGLYVLDEALNWCAKWRSLSSNELVISVNLSPSQFRNLNLYDHVMALLNKYDVPSESLELEITEGVLLSGYQYIDTMIDRLKVSGIGISMDDFGTGYSSLSYLRSYPFNTVKIDRSFIHDIIIDKADRELIYAAISMGHGLGLSVVAEGVESEEQRDMLLQMDCEYVQGFLYSRPVVPEAITRIIQQQ